MTESVSSGLIDCVLQILLNLAGNARQRIAVDQADQLCRSQHAHEYRLVFLIDSNFAGQKETN